MNGTVQRFIAFTARVGAGPQDSPELRLQKQMLVAASSMFIAAGALWGIMYFALGEYLAGAIPFGYAVFSSISVVVFARTRNFQLFRFTQLLLILLLPFLLQIALGGFINSSAVILWSIICPVGALAFSGLRSALRWFLAYLALIALSGFLQAYTRPANNLSPALILFFFVMNIAAVSAILFAILAYFISQKEIFSYFDSLLDKYGVEKIRTIGDNYMAASGVPTPRPDHAQQLARMALDMCAYIESRPPRNGKRLDFRIGINSGPVIAGVIGKRKFVYDLWGDPVNTASRMESNGVPGRIQITQATYELIKAEFLCEPRGKITIKGKGEMETWYLVGAKNAM